MTFQLSLQYMKALDCQQSVISENYAYIEI